MKYIILISGFILLSCSAFAQTIIGGSPSAAIEFQDIDKGMLLPKVVLSTLSNAAPLPNHIQGMLVFNTAIQNNVTPGIYYNNGSQWLRLSSSNTPLSNFVEFLTIGNEIRLEGGTGSNALIQKNGASSRDELQIYAGGDAYTGGSRGAGIHLYGNSDNEHDGNIAFLTGPSGQGNGRMIISGAYNEARVTIGNNNIWDFVDTHEDTGMVNLRDPVGRPALCIFQASASEGDIAVPDGDAINFGHWSGQTFTSRLEIDSQGRVGVGTTSPNAALEVVGGILMEEVTSIPNATSEHGGLYVFNGELYAYNESGNHTVISPHHFSLIEPSEKNAWSYYSKDEETGIEINVDMMRALRIIEKLSGEKLIYTKQ